LTEDTPQAFAQAHSLRLLPEDGIATNPAVSFKVETFAPRDGFKTTKPYATRLMWRDQDGNEQSKLLVTKPETVIALALRGEEPGAAETQTPRRAARPPAARRRSGARPEPA